MARFPVQSKADIEERSFRLSMDSRALPGRGSRASMRGAPDYHDQDDCLRVSLAECFAGLLFNRPDLLSRVSRRPDLLRGLRAAANH